MTTNTTPFTAAAQASGQAPSAAMSDEIEGLRAHVALLKAALAQAERENDELRAQPAAATAAPGEPTPELQRMTASRAAFFMERFLREEKLPAPRPRKDKP